LVETAAEALPLWSRLQPKRFRFGRDCSRSASALVETARESETTEREGVRLQISKETTEREGVRLQISKETTEREGVRLQISKETTERKGVRLQISKV